MMSLHERHLEFSKWLLYPSLCLTVIHIIPFSSSLLTEPKATADPDSTRNYTIIAPEQSNNTKEQDLVFPTNSSFETILQSQSENSSVNFNSSNLLHISNSSTLQTDTDSSSNNSTEVFSGVALTTTAKPKRKPMRRPFTEEDKRVRAGWGGTCGAANWKKCSKILTWFGDYFEDINNPETSKVLKFDIDCKIQPIICMRNGWTVTRCQIFCMSRCNKELMIEYDKYVEKDGMCDT